MSLESAVSTWHGISSANQIKASNFGSRIPILHANLELGPSFSHPPHVATQGFMRRLAEDHGTNLLFKTWFMNNLLLSIGRNSFSKNCWNHCSSFSPQFRQRKFFNRLVNSPQTVHSLRPFCSWEFAQCLGHVTKVLLWRHWIAPFFLVRKFVSVPLAPPKKTGIFFSANGKICRWIPKSTDQPQIHWCKCKPQSQFLQSSSMASRFHQGPPNSSMNP